MPAEDWASSGLAALTGAADGRPDFSRAPVLDEARATLARFVRAITAVTGRPAAELADLDAGQLLSARAALRGFRRAGRVSAGGASRLLRARDGWAAITLSRDADLELLPALLCLGSDPLDPWSAVAERVARLPAADFVDRARLLGLPAARLGEAEPSPPRIRRRGGPIDVPRRDGLLVADLSSLWAGPLCGHLLARAGATVVKVESPTRPDGARHGDPEFFDWMNGGKLSTTIDLAAEPGRAAALLRHADVVIEASRPRTLRRHGLGAEQLTPGFGQVWLRITAHGAEDPAAEWVGFGDDAAVAGGLVGHDDDNEPVFCGDAIADPLTGIEAAALAAEALAHGGGRMIDVALAHTAARYDALGTAAAGPVSQRPNPVVAPPRFASTIMCPGPALGAHDAELDRILVDHSRRRN